MAWGVVLMAILATVGAIVNVSVINAKQSSQVETGTSFSFPPPPPPPSPPLPQGTCARYIAVPEFAGKFGYLVNSCEENVLEADCVAPTTNDTVFWTTSANCSVAPDFYGYDNSALNNQQPFFPCCPSGYVLLPEVSTSLYNSYSNLYEIQKYVCVEIKTGDTQLDNRYRLNQTLVTRGLAAYDATTSVPGATCSSFVQVAFGQQNIYTEGDVTPLEKINALGVCEACIFSAYGNAVASCELQNCNYPFALPAYTQIPYVGACARYTPHPVLPGYNNSCTMTLETDCALSSVPGELVHWTDERTNMKCRNIDSPGMIEYDNAKRSALFLCPTDHVLLRRTEGGRTDYWCLDKDTPWTGYAGTGTYTFYTNVGCTISQIFTQDENIGTLVGLFSGTPTASCFFRPGSPDIDIQSTDPFYAPIVNSL